MMRGSPSSSMFADFAGRDADLFRVPNDLHRGVVLLVFRLDDFSRNAGNLRHPIGDVPEPGAPLGVLGVAVALSGAQQFDGFHHADDLFLAHLHRTREGVVRGAVHERGGDQILAAEKHPGGLRSPNDLAAGVGDQIDAAREVRIRHKRQTVGDVHDDGNAVLVSGGNVLLERKRIPVSGKIDLPGRHRRPRGEGFFEVLQSLRPRSS